MNNNFEKVSECLHSPETLKAVNELNNNIIDKTKGIFAGNIIGDIIGVSLVWKKTKIKIKRPLKLEGDIITRAERCDILDTEPGDWTDDTSMLIALGESLIESKMQVNPENELKQYQKWLNEGFYSSKKEAFDVGRTTQAALKEGNPPVGREFNGNGSLMRSSIISIAYLNKSDKLMDEASGASCSVTHIHPISKFCNVIYNKVLKRLIYDVAIIEIIEEMKLKFSGLIEDIDPIFTAPEEYSNSGYCVSTLQTALWICEESDNFEEAVLKAVNLGGDSDTIGAVTGAIAGAMYGYSSIPEYMKKYLDNPELTKYNSVKHFLHL